MTNFQDKKYHLSIARDMGMGIEEIGTSRAADIAREYELAGKPLHAAKYYLLSGYGLTGNIDYTKISRSRLNMARLSAIKFIRNCSASHIYAGRPMRYYLGVCEDATRHEILLERGMK
jgi:hypothetical protein